MNRILLTITIIANFVPLVKAQTIRGFYNHEKLNGKVISVTEMECVYNRMTTGDTYATVDTIISIIKYNLNGEAVTQDYAKHYDHRFPDTAIRKRDSLQNALLSYSAIFSYDYKNGKLSNVIRERHNAKSVFKYNNKGEVYEQDDYDINEKIIFKTSHWYDNNGNLTKSKMRSVGTVQAFGQTYIFKYDKNNKKIEELVYEVGNSIMLKSYFEYTKDDNMGNWIACTRSNIDKTLKHLSYRQIRYAN